MSRQSAIGAAVFVSTSDTLLLTANTNRSEVVIVNTTADNCFLLLGQDVVTQDHFTYKLPRGGTLECGPWGGEIHALMQNTPGVILVTAES